MPQLNTLDGARIHYETAGEVGPRMLLVHGGTGTGAYDWEGQRPLASQYRLLIPDLRGHGRSTDPSGRLSLETIAEDMQALIDSTGEPIDAIVGFSIGATSMLQMLTHRRGLTRAFVAIGASVRGDPGRVEQILAGPWPEELRNLRHESSEDPDHWKELRRRLARSWADSLNLRADELASVDCPALICCGDRDRIEPVETATQIARSIPAGELLVLPRAGHFAHRDRPGAFNAALAEFLDRVLV